MKRLILLVLALTAYTLVIGQSKYQISSSNMTIAGTSTLHDWESEASQVNMTGTFLVANGELKSISDVAVEVAVEKIKSPKGSMMDKKTYEALKSDKFPSITYNLTKVQSITKKGNAYEANTTGTLTIAGVKKTVNLLVVTTILPNGQLEITGSAPIKMTDYNMEPPTALMGSIKTGNDVTVSFKVVMAPKNI